MSSLSTQCNVILLTYSTLYPYPGFRRHLVGVEGGEEVAQREDLAGVEVTGAEQRLQLCVQILPPVP